jgi:hypothetical protein
VRYKNETTPWGKSETIKLFSVYTSRQYGKLKFAIKKVKKNPNVKPKNIQE